LTTKPQPRLEFQVIPAVPPPAGESGVAIDADSLLPRPEGVYLKFLTVAGGRYYVQYRANLTGSDWHTAYPPVIGTGSQMLWLDNGPPKTESKPAGAGSRYYRLLLVP
jgi:hypothetical protein